MPEKIATKGKFAIPGSDPEKYSVFEGWDRGDLGCGNFYAPFFERNVAMKICKQSKVKFDPKTKNFIDKFDGTVYPAELIDTTEGKKLLYKIGGGGWVWEKE
jgi:hypothetical protein